MRQRRLGDPWRTVRDCSPSQSLPQSSAALLSCYCELKHELLTQQVSVTETHTVCTLSYSDTLKNNLTKQQPCRQAHAHAHGNMTRMHRFVHSGLDGERKQWSWLTPMLNVTFILCSIWGVCVCVCVSHLWKQLLWSPSPLPHPVPTLSQQLTVTYCPPCLNLLLPHSLTSAPVPSPTSPFPLSTFCLISHCSLPSSVLSPVWHRSLPTAHTKCSWHCCPLPTSWYHPLCYVLFTLMEVLLSFPQTWGTGRSWKIAVGKQIRKFPLIIT